LEKASCEVYGEYQYEIWMRGEKYGKGEKYG